MDPPKLRSQWHSGHGAQNHAYLPAELPGTLQNIECPLHTPHRINALQWIWGVLSTPNWDVPHHPKWRLKGHFWIVAAWGLFLEASSISPGLRNLWWSQSKHLSLLVIEVTSSHLKMLRNLSLQITLFWVSPHGSTLDHSRCRCTPQAPSCPSPHTVEISQTPMDKGVTGTFLTPRHSESPSKWHILRCPQLKSTERIFLHALSCSNVERSSQQLWRTHYYIQFVLPGDDKDHIWIILMVHTLFWHRHIPSANVRVRGGSSGKTGNGKGHIFSLLAVSVWDKGWTLLVPMLYNMFSGVEIVSLFLNFLHSAQKTWFSSESGVGAAVYMWDNPTLQGSIPLLPGTSSCACIISKHIQRAAVSWATGCKMTLLFIYLITPFWPRYWNKEGASTLFRCVAEKQDRLASEADSPPSSSHQQPKEEKQWTRKPKISKKKNNNLCCFCSCLMVKRRHFDARRR